MYWDNRKERKIIVKTLRTQDNILVNSFATPFGAENDSLDIAREKKYPVSLVKLYEALNAFRIDWKSKELDVSVSGLLKILPLEKTFQDWKGVVYFEDSNERIRNFIPIDFFADEACVGVFVGEDSDDCAYFYNFAEDPKPLHIDMCAYFDLALMARGFLYWQYAIFSINENRKYTSAEDFKNQMPQIFEDFNYNQFVAKV